MNEGLFLTVIADLRQYLMMHPDATEAGPFPVPAAILCNCCQGRYQDATAMLLKSVSGGSEWSLEARCLSLGSPTEAGVVIESAPSPAQRL